MTTYERLVGATVSIIADEMEKDLYGEYDMAYSPIVAWLFEQLWSEDYMG